MTDTGLNLPQQAAVEHFGSPLLVIAGAGSGKTRVITEKIVRLIRNQGLPARHIAAITFTNKAAKEMQARVKILLSKEESRGLNVSTFHTLGLKIIRQELKTLGYKSGFSIFDSQDSTTLLKELARKDNLEEDDAARWQISTWKNGFISPVQALASAEDGKSEYHARLYERYQRQLQAYNAMDFDDLIVLPVQLLEAQPEIREKWQNRLRYLLIDEYQDTNACQYRLVKHLTGVEGRFTVVGDDDQSIYAWRGAQPENLALLGKDFPTLKLIKLEQNYRSTTHILEAANKLIARNPHVFEKQLWSALGEGRKLQVMPCNNADVEVQNVISEILSLKFKHRAAYGDFAILYRGNHQSRLFESRLREQNIPYKVSGGTSFFARAEIKDIIGYLRLMTNPDDDTAFLRIVNTPRREIGASTLEKLGAYATQRNTSLFSASFEMGLAETLSGRALMRLQRFTDWVRELSLQIDDSNAASVTRSIVTQIGYSDWLNEVSSSPKVAEKRMENIEELISWIGKLADAENNARNLSEIVSHMLLMDILERNEDETSDDKVQLMTLHAAKGLEFPHVFIVGMEEELLPHKNSMEDDMLEEERRLAYVGITRAQQSLTFSYANKRQKFGEATDCEPSRFLEEIPPEYLEWDKPSQMSSEERLQQGRAHLHDLKALLDL